MVLQCDGWINQEAVLVSALIPEGEKTMSNPVKGLSCLAAVLIVVATACLPAAPGQSGALGPGVTGDKITLGLQADLTGGGSLVGQGAKHGVDMAVKEINDHGGVNGRKLDTVVADAASTPDGGLLAARKLVQQDNVFAILGCSTSSSTVSVLPFIRTVDTPYYASIPSDPRVLDPFTKHIFEGAALPQTTVVPLEVEFLTKTLKGKSIALAVSSDAYAIAARNLIVPEIEKQGAKAATVQNFTAGDTDFTAQIQAIKSANPDVLMIIGLPADGARFLTQARRAGLTIPMVGDSAQADKQTVSLAGPSAEGYYTFWFSSPQFIDDRTGTMGAWRDAFEKTFPNPPPGVPNQWTLQAYSDVYVVAEALRRAGNTLTRENFVKQLETIQNFVGGKDENLKYAFPVGLPRSFTATDHQGSRTLVPVVVKDGAFKPAG